jgi:hypothetical protein
MDTNLLRVSKVCEVRSGQYLSLHLKSTLGIWLDGISPETAKLPVEENMTESTPNQTTAEDVFPNKETNIEGRLN